MLTRRTLLKFLPTSLVPPWLLPRVPPAELELRRDGAIVALEADRLHRERMSYLAALIRDNFNRSAISKAMGDTDTPA